MDDFDIYLGSDIGQKNMNNDPKKSNFNELVIIAKVKNYALDLNFIVVRKGDLALQKNRISKTMKEEFVYVEISNSKNSKKIHNEVETFLFDFETELKKSKIKCGNLWEIYGEKPKETIFLKCNINTENKKFEAEYKVKGKDIATVENLLVKKYGMGRLKFVCCQYECTNGIHGIIESQKLMNLINLSYIDIWMYSHDDVLTKDRKLKKLIEMDYVYVNVTISYR